MPDKPAAESPGLPTTPPWEPVKSLNIYQRMLMAMSICTSVVKERTATVTTQAGGSYSYRFAGHDVVARVTHPVLVQCGIYPLPMITKWEQDKDTTVFDGKVRFINVDKPEEWVEVPGVGYGQDKGDKGPGKAYSYMVKMSLLKGLLLESGDPDVEDDHQNRGSSPGKASGGGSAVASEKSTAYMRQLLRRKERRAILQAIKGGADYLAQAAGYLGLYEKAKEAGDGAPQRPSQDVVSKSIDTLNKLPDGGAAPEGQGEPGRGAEGSQEPAGEPAGAPPEGEALCQACGALSPISAPDCLACGAPLEPPAEGGE